LTAVRKNQHAIGAEAIEALIGGLKMHGKRRREMIHLHWALVCTFFGGAQQAVAAQPKEGRLSWHCDRHDRASQDAHNQSARRISCSDTHQSNKPSPVA
jgi:hypothetical protein